MMNLPWNLIRLSLFILIIGSFPIYGDELTILSEVNRPFTFSPESLRRGIAIDLLDEILKSVDCDISIDSIQFMPWARAYDYVLTRPGTLLFPMARTPEREDLFYWIGPIYTMKIGLIGRKSAGIKIETLNDLERYSIAVVHDGAPEVLLRKLDIDQQKINDVTSIDQLLKMLILGRVDLIAYNIPSTLYSLKMMKEDPSSYDFIS